MWYFGRDRDGYVLVTACSAATMRVWPRDANGSALPVRLHRWILSVPRGGETLHSCDSPSCIQPSHISIGTHSENLRDAWRRTECLREERRSSQRAGEGRLRVDSARTQHTDPAGLYRGSTRQHIREWLSSHLGRMHGRRHRGWISETFCSGLPSDGAMSAVHLRGARGFARLWERAAGEADGAARKTTRRRGARGAAVVSTGWGGEASTPRQEKPPTQRCLSQEVPTSFRRNCAELISGLN